MLAKTSRQASRLALLGLAGLLLIGCAATPATDATPTEWQTRSDDSPARTRARTRLALASGYYENGQHGVALDEIKKALQIDPSFAAAYNLSGMIYLALGDVALAESHFDRAIALNPKDGNALHNLGWLQCEKGRYAPAAVLFQRAVAIPTYTDRARTLMAQGVCEARSGNPEKAEATLMRSYELDAGNPITGYNLSLLLFQRGELERARFYIRRINNSDLANAESLWLGIRVEHRLKDRKSMEQLADQLRRRFPESRELQAYEQGRFDA